MTKTVRIVAVKSISKIEKDLQFVDYEIDTIYYAQDPFYSSDWVEIMSAHAGNRLPCMNRGEFDDDEGDSNTFEVTTTIEVPLDFLYTEDCTFEDLPME